MSKGETESEHEFLILEFSSPEIEGKLGKVWKSPKIGINRLLSHSIRGDTDLD